MTNFSKVIVVVGSLVGVGLLALAGCASSVMPPGTRHTDAGITSAIEASLRASDEVSARQVAVETREGVVYLTGAMETADARREAGRVAWNTEGVSSVTNALTLGEGPRDDARAVDPDDGRLVDVVRLIESGVSESVIAEHVRQSGRIYRLSVDDLLYLKQNGARESTIAALMATDVEAVAAPAAAPGELVFEDLVLVKSGLMNGARKGRLVLDGDTLAWEGRRNRKEDFTFETTGLEKVWLTCEARAAEDFCYQINFKITKGDRYRFRDLNRDAGSNAAVTEVMEALRVRHPRLDYTSSTTTN